MNGRKLQVQTYYTYIHITDIHVYATKMEHVYVKCFFPPPAQTADIAGLISYMCLTGTVHVHTRLDLGMGLLFDLFDLCLFPAGQRQQ